jgi:hypothetical protein
VNELINVLRRFIARDLVFLIGGGSVVGSFLYTFTCLPTPDEHVVLFLFLGGVSYVVGYVVQDGFALLGLVPTTNPRRLPRWLARLYARYVRDQRQQWRDLPDTDFERAEENLTPDQALWLERITTLQQVGATVGPCWVVSAGLLVVRLRLNGVARFGLVLAIGGFGLALVLFCLAWIKAAQQAQYLARHDRPAQ